MLIDVNLVRCTDIESTYVEIIRILKYCDFVPFEFSRSFCKFVNLHIIETTD